MGPCRLNAKAPYDKVGVCGATMDTIMARNFARMVSSGAAAHTDHGMSMLELFREVVNGKIKDYRIKDPQKLVKVAQSVGIETEGKSVKEVALELYDELERTYTQVEGEMPFAKRVPEKTLETWRKHGVVPRGAMREIMELMHRTHMGVDQDYENITRQCSRTALADGWGGSMVATEISDILFGTPSPVAIEVNMGVLKEDQVNIIVHGHEPNLFESMIASVNEPTLVEAAKAAGAKGINLVGMCCSGAEVLVRHGIPHAGNFMSTEAVLVTGAVDALTVDVQCIKQGLGKVADCYGTLMFTTNPRCRIEGVAHVELDEHDPGACTDEIVIKAISRFKNRTRPVQIPNIVNQGCTAFPTNISVHAGRFFPRFIPAAQRQHHQRPYPRGRRGGGLYQPQGQTGLGACGAGQRTDQERCAGAADRLLPDRAVQGGADDARSRGAGRRRIAGSV
jgi:carbon-monoxide dehydrogenase catalytic subunit